MSAVRPDTIDAAAALTPEGFAAIQDATLARAVEIYPARAWYPSALGHPCDRFLVWRFTRWQEQAPHGPTLQSIFDDGRHHQADLYRRLEAMGFDLVRESDRPRQYKVGSAVISGRIDGKLRGFRGARYDPPRLLEAKSMAAHAWDRLTSAHDLLASPEPWNRSYFAQGQLYCLLEDTPAGVFVLKNKATGLLKCLPYELDLEYAEGLLQRVERLQPLVEQESDPDPIPYDRRTCGGCGFLHVCWPAVPQGAGVEVLDDPALLADLEERDRLAAAHRDYEAVDRAVKARLRASGITTGLCGPFSIETTTRERTGYTVEPGTVTTISIRRLDAET